jgi:hypothetical protein
MQIIDNANILEVIRMPKYEYDLQPNSVQI